MQINHPHLDVAFVTTTEWTVRQAMKVLMAALSLAGITGMYLRQVTQTGVLGLIGYLTLRRRLPHHAEHRSHRPVRPPGDRAQLTRLRQRRLRRGHRRHTDRRHRPDADAHPVVGVTFLGGGLLFGIALFRANILARWAAALLAVGAVATVAIPLLPQVNQRLFAIPPASP